MMTPDQERMARAPAFVAERLCGLALAGDAAGVERWQAIAARLAHLRAASRVAH